MINSLTDRMEGRLAGEAPERFDDQRPDFGLARSVRLDGRRRIRVEQHSGGLQLTIAAADRIGLFADTVALLAVHTISVRSAVVTTTDGVTVNTWWIDLERVADLPDVAYLSKQLQRLGLGDKTVLETLRRREERSQRVSGQPAAQVIKVKHASDSAAVIEARATDRSGLLFGFGQALAAERLSIRSAHITTLARQAIDVFYLQEEDETAPSAQRTMRAAELLLAAAHGPEPAADPSIDARHADILRIKLTGRRDSGGGGRGT